MGKARILAPWVGELDRSAVYSTCSRIVDRQFVLGEVEKDMFVTLMRMYEDFCGVHVLASCCMSNHVHILLEVPPRPAEGISDEEILRRYRRVQSADSVALLEMQLVKYKEAQMDGSLTDEGLAAYEELREKCMRRMWDMGEFMKTLKQRFSRWFNKEHGRVGTLWESRYHSSLVEDGETAMVVAAYIDLNPVRAGMLATGACTPSRSSAGACTPSRSSAGSARSAGDPKDYRWSSYGAAMAGDKAARAGIARVVQMCDTEWDERGETVAASDLEHYGWRSIAGRYRVFLYESGRAPGESDLAQAQQGAKRNRRKGFSDEEIEEVRARAGELSVAAKLLTRSRYFVDGAVIGSKGFVNGVIAKLNGAGYWAKPRVTGASRVTRYKKDDAAVSGSVWSMRRL